MRKLEHASCAAGDRIIEDEHRAAAFQAKRKDFGLAWPEVRDQWQNKRVRRYGDGDPGDRGNIREADTYLATIV